jgi:pilus assembly protein CpaB
MQKKAIFLLVLALVMGGLAVILVRNMIEREVMQRGEVEVVETVKVVVAAVDLKMGMRLDEISVREVDWPKNLAPEGVFGSVTTLLGEEAPIVLKEIRKDEVILPYKLSPHGARGGLPRKIPEDMRAVTISVSEVTGVAGFVLPGDYVDVILTTNPREKNKKPTTHTLLQNIRVLGVDQLSTEEEDKPKVVNAVTLLIYPNEGKQLILAQEIGNLNLLLRNEFDASIIEDQLVSYKDLMMPTKESPRRIVSKPKVYKRIRRPTVEVIRGLNIETQSVVEGVPPTPPPREPAIDEPTTE